MKWLHNLFRNNNKEYFKDFSIISTDIHSHLIPSIDDGSKDLETSINIIKKLSDLGFKKIITTPHVMSDLYRNDSKTIMNGLKVLQQEVVKQKIDIILSAAAEYYIDYEFVQNIGKQDFLTFGNNFLLIEHSFHEAPKDFFNIIFKLQTEGYNVVLAHPERYQFYQIDDYKKLIDKGVYLQLNLLSLTNYYSLNVSKKVQTMIDRKMFSFVGTDCHNQQQAELYVNCMRTNLFTDLVNKNFLLNHTL